MRLKETLQNKDLDMGGHQQRFRGRRRCCVVVVVVGQGALLFDGINQQLCQRQGPLLFLIMFPNTRGKRLGR